MAEGREGGGSTRSAVMSGDNGTGSMVPTGNIGPGDVGHRRRWCVGRFSFSAKVGDVTGSEVDSEVTDRLRGAGQRYTTGRRRIVDALRDGPGPMTMNEILAADERLAQSSVYRNLVILEQVGAVARIVTRDDYARYELAEDLTEHHHHLICSTCGSVEDFALEADVETNLDQALLRAAHRFRFTPDTHRLDLVGTCASCDQG